MKNKLIRRVLTVIFSVVFIVSTVLGTLPSFATGSNKTDLVNAVEFTTAAASVSSGTTLRIPNGTENALSGKEPVYKKFYFKGNLDDLVLYPSVKNFTDGDTETQTRSSSSKFAEKNAAGTEATYYTDGTEVYADLIYALDKVSNIQQITFVSAGNDTGSYATTTAEYKIYVGDEQGTLISDANMVAHVNNRTEKKRVQNITVKDGKTLSGKYVGVRIIDPTITKSENAVTNILANNDNNVYPRLNEFAVFTEIDYSGISRATVESDSTIELPAYNSESGITNLVLNKAPKVYKNQGSGDVATTVNYTNIVDGNVSTTQDCNIFNFASASIDDKGTEDKSDDEVINQVSHKEEWSLAYVFDTGKADNVLDKLVYISGSTSNMLAAGHYTVYASNDTDNLFDMSNFVLDFKNTTKQRRQVISFDNVNARYVGIRISDPIADWSNVFKIDSSGNVGTYFARPRIAEIAIFGKEKKSVNLFEATSTEDYDTDTTLGDSNLISGKTATVNYYSNFGADVQKNVYFASGRLTDGLFNDNARNASAVFAEYEGGVSKYIGSGITEGKYYVDIIFNLDAKAEISGFELFSSSNNDLKTYHYQVFLSESESDLFSDDSMVTDFYNTDNKTHNAFKNTDANKTYIAQYVGVRVLDPTCGKGTGGAVANNPSNGNNEIYPRIQEFTVYGKKLSVLDFPKSFDDQKEMITHTDTNLAKEPKEVYVEYFNGVDAPQKSTEKIARLTDEDIVSETYSSTWPMATYDAATGVSKYIGQGITEGSMYTDVIFDFGVEASLSAMTLFHHVSANNDKTFVTDHYQVFFSNKKDELFTGTPFIDVDDNSNIRNVLNLNMLNGNQNVEARYVGIRVLDPTTKKGEGMATAHHSDGNNYIYMRLGEVAIYGTLLGLPEGYGTYFDSKKELVTNWGTNMLKGLAPTVLATKDGETNKTGAVNVNDVTDENLNTQTRVSGVRYAELVEGVVKDYSSNGDGSVYVDMVFDMHSEVDITGAAVYSNSANLANTHYVLSAANKKSDLFTDAAWTMEVQNPDGHTRNAWNFDMMQYATDVKGRYFAIRILSPTKLVGSNSQTELQEGKDNNIYVRLQEISVFGSYTDKDFVYVPKFTPLFMNQATNDLLTKYGTNILVNKLPSETIKNGVGTGHNNEKSAAITDGDFNTQIDFKQTDGDKTEDTVFDLVWDLSIQGYFNVTDFIYRGTGSDADYVTGWYKVYMSDDYDMLFDDENCVFEYNIMDENSEDVVVGGQIVNFQKPVYACYFGLRIISPVYTAPKSIYPRIREFAVFGTKADVDTTPTNFANAMPVEAYLGEASGTLETVTDENFTASEVSNLTDENTSTTAEIKTNGKDLHLIYNLCQDADIYSIYTAGKAVKDVKNYNVYAASTLAGVWEEESLICSYKNNKQLRSGKTFMEPYNMRYVRFEFLDTAETVTLADIEIMGAKTYALRNKNLLKPVKSDNISVYKENLKTGEIKYNASVSTERLHDNFINNAVGFTLGKEGKESFNLTFDLGDIKTVNSLEIYFPNKAWKFMPEKGKIYIGQTLDDVSGDKAEADFIISKRPTTNSLTYTFKPQVARFIRICFTKGGNFEAYDEMCYAFAEIIAFGTNIKGMSVDDTENLMEFENKKQGVKWAIVQASTNDIAPNIVRSTVTVSKVTNRQKNSLNKSPYLKIVDDKKYTFKFYDAAGNEITDLGGRKVKYSFKLKGSNTADNTMIGYSGNKWYVQVLDSNGDLLKGYISAYSDDTFESHTVSFLKLTTENDPYWSKIGKLEEWGDEKPQYAPGAEADENFSGDMIITEDDNYYLKPLGSLTLPTDAQLVVEAITGTIPSDVYYGAATITDADKIAVSYLLSLNQFGMDYEFDGKVQMKLHIPEAVKGYFSDYSLVSIKDDGTAENVAFTRSGDYIYFETASVDNYALVGGTYFANGDAVLPETESSGVGTSPETGDNMSAIFYMIAIISLCAIVMLNMKALRKD